MDSTLMQALGALQLTINEIQKEVHQIPAMAEKIDRVHVALYGNSNPKGSMTDRLSILETEVDGVKSSIRWVKGYISAVAVTIVGFIGKEVIKLIGR